MIRTRFAPSPTGYLHIGGARTALFNWLYARHHRGKFILRIEDTDKVRSTREAIDAILESMEWLGLDWDEGPKVGGEYSPYYQSERSEIYRKHVDLLLKEGRAYYCYCTPEELKKKRELALSRKKKPKYDGHCRNLKRPVSGRDPVVRFKSPGVGTTEVDDLAKGKVIFDNSELDDLIIVRSDGSFTYNFVVVVDDATMKITDIIRGDDHLNNTPRQILLYRALEYPIPRFAHVPLILGPDKTRLSKRHGATSVMAYKEEGYLSAALVNYLVRLGWSYGDQEIFSREELIEKFTLDRVGKTSGIFNQGKLLWLSSHYIKASGTGNLVLDPELNGAGHREESLPKLLISFLKKKGYQVKEDERLCKIISTLKERSKTVSEMADAAEFFYCDDIVYEEKGAKKFLTLKIKDALSLLIERLEDLPELEPEKLEKIFREIIAEKNINLTKIAQAVRIALTGRTASPGIFEVMEILGKEKVFARLHKAYEFIEKGTDQISSNSL